MKRKTKNIIMITLIVALICSLTLTVIYSSNNKTSNNISASGMPNQGENTGTPPDMPSGDNQNGEGQGMNNNDGETPPEKPSGESDDMAPNDGETPPDLPSGENNQEMPEGNKDENGERPEMPSEGGNEPGTLPNENNMSTTDDQSNSYLYYILIGAQSLVLSSLIIYLIISGFNKKTIKETFSSNDKKIIYVLSIIILTAGLTFAVDAIGSNININSNSNQTNQGGNGQSNGNITYTSSNEIKESTTIDSGNYESTTADENALLINSEVDVSLSNIEVNKTGDSDGGDNTSFYGINSAILAANGATLTIDNIEVETDATGANGVFSYGGSATTNNTSSDGTTVNISNSKIVTKKDNSGGIMTTGGGIMNATNLDVTTAGISSAAIRTDRGGGTVTVNGGTYKTTGAGSPTVYSTADVTVKNAELIATTAEGIVIEGKNKVTLENVTLTDTNSKLNGQSTTYKNIFLYQSMSGDAAEGISEFSASNSTIITNKGDTLYVTNTNSTITLTNNKITNNDSTGNFLRVQKDSWGNSGSNGGNVTLILSNQEAIGNIVIDEISTLDMTLKDGSYYEGNLNTDNTANSIKLTLDKSSKIKLTANAYVTSLDNADSTNSNIDFNGYKLYVNGVAIN